MARVFRSGREHPALFGVPAEKIAEWLKCHITTARRYKRGEDPSYAGLQLIELRDTGNLGIVDPHWEGWRIRQGKLISPDQQTFSRGDVLSLPFVRMQVAHYTAESRLPKQADWVSGQWVPVVVNE